MPRAFAVVRLMNRSPHSICTQPDVSRCSKIGRRNVQHRFQHAAEMLDYPPAVRDARRRVRSFAFGRAATTRFDKEIIIKSQQTFLGRPEEQLVA